MKKLHLFFIFFLITSISISQNVTMAKAYYKKAQKEYENENYKEAISLLEKTVENLNGDTNPDIIYLLAKSRYEMDFNVNKAKALFKIFTTEADSSDERIDEVAQILVAIETSDSFYRNGNKKRVEYIFTNNNNRIIDNYDEEGFVIKKEIYYSNRNYQLGEIKYYNNGNIVSIEIYSSTRELSEVQYHVNDFIIIVKHGSIIVHGSSFIVIVYNKDGKRIQEYRINEDISIKSFETYEYFNSIEDMETSTFLLDSGNSNILIEELINRPLDSNLNAKHKHLSFKLGMVKKLYYSSGRYNYRCRYYFDSSGKPKIKKEFNKKEKLKATYIYNYGSWTKE